MEYMRRLRAPRRTKAHIVGHQEQDQSGNPVLVSLCGHYSHFAFALEVGGVLRGELCKLCERKAKA